MSSRQNEDDIQLQHQAKRPDEIEAETIETVNPDLGDHRPQGDKAAEFLEANVPEHESVVVSPEENKRVLRKIDIALLPILLCGKPSDLE